MDGRRPQFPETPQDKKASWSKDGLTCTLPVTSSPRDYQLGINSPSHTNFQSQWGVPLAPVVYRFRTADKK